MKLTLLAVAAAGSLAALSAAPADAQRYSNWRVVGYKTVDGRDSDSIKLRGDTRYRQIRLCAANAPIRMRDVDVRFENGRSQDINVRQRLNAGTCTRNIDLSGNRRDIKLISLRYEPIARGYRRPIIRVQAR